ncbi:hypothetical protein BDZ45DRAFT_765985 [Acephala macrosclerotiorum]|nr:hypothetical protein BDZ45DRAFT_765985 [Acephala macrosclerotiorum]
MGLYKCSESPRVTSPPALNPYNGLRRHIYPFSYNLRTLVMCYKGVFRFYSWFFKKAAVKVRSVVSTSQAGSTITSHLISQAVKHLPILGVNEVDDTRTYNLFDIPFSLDFVGNEGAGDPADCMNLVTERYTNTIQKGVEERQKLDPVINISRCKRVLLAKFAAAAPGNRKLTVALTWASFAIAIADASANCLDGQCPERSPESFIDLPCLLWSFSMLQNGSWISESRLLHGVCTRYLL